MFACHIVHHDILFRLRTGRVMGIANYVSVFVVVGVNVFVAFFVRYTCLCYVVAASLYARGLTSVQI